MTQTKLTKEQEDYLLLNEQEPSIALSGFKRDNKCQFCGTERATETIEDGETLQEINICKSCLNSILGKYIELNQAEINCCLNTKEK